MAVHLVFYSGQTMVEMMAVPKAASKVVSRAYQMAELSVV